MQSNRIGFQIQGEKNQLENLFDLAKQEITTQERRTSPLVFFVSLVFLDHSLELYLVALRYLSIKC